MITNSRPPVKTARRKKIKLLLVDDHTIVREGIKAFLSTQDDLKIVADAGNGQEAIEAAKKYSPDVILMDINMPTMNGLEAVSRLKRHAPNSKILMLTMHDNREYIAKVSRLGARGYLMKDTEPSEMVEAIHEVYDGNAYFGPEASRVLLEELSSPSDTEPEEEEPVITEREKEVLILIAEGGSNKGIADHLGVNVRTVETHRENLKRKLGIDSVAGLIKYAIRNGWVQP